MSARDVIVQLVGNTFGSGDEFAEDLLGTLKGHGYVVVELPDPSDSRYPGEWSSTTAPAPDEWDVWLDGRRNIQVRTQGYATAAGARFLAAGLLAAADAAEASA